MKEKVEMYFKQLKLQNYSLFKDFQITPAKTGVNIILGPNNSGKTQIAGSFLIPLFSRNAVSKYPHALENESNIFLSIYGTNNQQDIKCTLRTKGESFEYIREIIETNPTGSDLRKKLVLPLKEGRSPSIIFTNRIPNEEFNEKDIEFINESFRSSPFTTISEKEYQFIITNYCSRKISSNIISEGERHFLSWLREFSYRKTSTDNYPLIIDDEFSMMDHYHRRLICLLISSIAEKSQVILFTTDLERLSGIPNELIATKTELEILTEERIVSSFGYQYGFLENLVPKRYLRKRHTNEPIKFNLGETFRNEENRFYEFKEVKGKNPVSSIVNVADIYVVSFLNSGFQQDGKILWGITDSDNKIVGVKLSRKERDDIRKYISEKFAQIEPPVVLSIFKIVLHQVFYNNKPLEDVFILEITIPKNDSKYLYSTSNKEVYLKTDGGRKKLTPLQLQLEILHRHGINV